MEFPDINYADVNNDIAYINEKFKDEYLKIKNKVKINRTYVIKHLNIMIHDYESSITIEAGIFEYAMLYSIINNIALLLIDAIYHEKYNSIVSFLKKYNITSIDEIKKHINNNKLQTLAFMKPHELYPEIYENLIRKQKLKDEKKKNIATTDLYQCYKCGERKCQVTEMQTRSCDEPSTKFVVCLVCNNVFKK